MFRVLYDYILYYRVGIWHQAKRVSLSSSQSDVKIDFTVPITACNLMIEYSEFYENNQVKSAHQNNILILMQSPLVAFSSHRTVGGISVVYNVVPSTLGSNLTGVH